MPVSISNSYSADIGKRTTSYTFPNVVVAATECIYVFLQSGTKNPNSNKYATGITFNGSENFEKVGIGQAQNGEATSEIWRLINPTPTTADVVITYVDNNATWEGAVGGVYVLAGVDIGGTPDDGFQSNSGSSTSISIGITTTSGDFTIDGASVRNSGDLTETGDGVELFSIASDALSGGSSYFTANDSQSSHTWTVTSADWVVVGVSINPSGPPPPGWEGTIDGVINPTYIDGIVVASVASIDGV